MDYLLKSPNAIENYKYFKHPERQTIDLQAENIKNIFTRVGKLRSSCSQYCSTAVNFNKANMLTLGIQNIRETVCIMYCTSLPRFQKGKNKIKRGSHATP